MAAPGVQFNSEMHLTYFEPTVDQYVKKLGQALASGDMAAAQQALANLDKAITTAPRSSGEGIGLQSSQQVSANLKNMGSALQTGDLTAAEGALGELRNELSSARSNSLDGTGYVGQSPSTNPGDVESPPEGGQDGSGKVDLRA